MSRYIDADELKRNHMFYHEADNRSYAEERDIDETPTVDAVPVVRCRECKHTKDDGCGAIYCKIWDKWEMPEDFYCADGERRTNEQQT